LAFIKKAIDLNDAGVDRCLPGLKHHIAGRGLIVFSPWIDFPIPSRRRFFFNIKITATMLHDRHLHSVKAYEPGLRGRYPWMLHEQAMAPRRE
jgi:hypothetical protein